MDISVQIIHYFALIAVATAVAAVGCMHFWRDSSNLIHSASHTSVSFSAISSIFAIPHQILAILGAILIVLANDFFSKHNKIITTNAAISLLSGALMLLGVSLEMQLQGTTGLHSVLLGDIFFCTAQEIILILIISIALFVFYAKNALKIAIGITFNKQSRLANSKVLRVMELMLVIILSKILGIIVVSIVCIIFPVIAREISKTPRSMLFSTLCVSIFIIFFSYNLTIYFDFYFSAVLTIISVLSLLLIFSKPLCKKLCFRF